MKKISLTLVITILLTLFLASCSKTDKQLYEQTEAKMDTTVRLKGYGPGAKEAVEEAMQRIDEIEKIASPSIETSDVNKINNAAGKEYVKVHPETMKMIMAALKFSKLSDGAFDITVGPLIKLWSIGTKDERVPSDVEIKETLKLVGYDKISINEAESSIRLEKAGMSIDLGGVAKGFAVDEIVNIFKKHNVKNALINLGSSSIYAMGKNESNLPWSIGIQHPRSERNESLLGIIKISNEGISTSGDYERYFIKDGKRYHHILDPKTGYPTDNGDMSDTIFVDGSVPDNSMIADILTTAVFVLGPEKGIKLVEGLEKVSCEVTTTDYKIYESPGFSGKLQNLNSEFKYITQ